MSSKPPTTGLGKYDSDAYRREQEFCLDAISSGQFDDLTDAEWIALCERIAQKKTVSRQEVAAVVAGSADDDD